jgi:alkylation response protein AidB-like acyl-CoA dehydrogenase
LANKPLIEYQDVQLALADMLMKISAMRATVWHAVSYEFSYQAAGAIAKVFCADTSWEVCNQAMELMGDHGFLQTNKAEKAARDARLAQIYEGTNQINRLGIFEGQSGADF